MSRVTVSRMYDAQDAEDRRLLEAKDHKQLLANYLNQIRERCAIRVRDPFAADDVAQTIVLRLWSELESGKHGGPVPFRVVVWKVTEWMIGGHFKPNAPAEVPLLDWDGAGPDDQAEWEGRYHLEQLAATLPERQRQVFELVYFRGLTPGEAADELGVKPNAAYQALHNAHRSLAEKADDW
jgi:RNA polymerase sigma factor (sigma-70 family)